MARNRVATAVLGAALLGVVGVGLPASAASADPLGVIEGEVLDLKADRLEVDVERGTAVLEGNVRAHLGALEVECAKVELEYDGSPRVRRARGTGGVVARMKGIEAVASAVDVDVAARKVELTGKVRLTRGRGWVEAGRATLDIATLKVSLSDVSGSIPVEPRH